MITSRAMLPDSPLAGPVTFALGPSFAAPDAARLHEALLRTAPEIAVEIQFHRVREWEAAALAVLARDLVERAGKVTVSGISQRQLRVLHYLGVDARG